MLHDRKSAGVKTYISSRRDEYHTVSTATCSSFEPLVKNCSPDTGLPQPCALVAPAIDCDIQISQDSACNDKTS